MANTIRHKRGTTTPGAGSLVTGELAINTSTGAVFTKTDGGSVVNISAGGGVTLADLGNGNATAGALVLDALDNSNAPSATNPFATEGDLNSAVNSIASDPTIARLSSALFTGTPAAPTAAAGTNTTQLATTAFVRADNNVKAWVNFNGTGTVAIRASLNVTSITDNGTGDYTVNFTTAMIDANYAFSISWSNWAGNLSIVSQLSSSAPTSSGIRLRSGDSAGNLADSALISVAIYR